MDSHSLGLGITQVQSILHWLDPDQEYTSSIIITSEFKVFKTIDFEIPLVTSLDCIEKLRQLKNDNEKSSSTL
ncbi:hypothetical protein HCN44_000191 [Aphidius gifuensis]|uniref:Uncharacterized protein n=1 Tax=Aphidius gifuensis TaxID=684658 RepID=A0A834XP92_APHGI|nr:hypothetical protein HCN44_000191 [Aphidius gifuensis]